MDPRPEGIPPARLSAFLGLLLVLPGVWALVPSSSGVDGGTTLSPPLPPAALIPGPESRALLWVFFSPEAWSRGDQEALPSRIPIRIRYRSDWLQAVSVVASRDQAARLASEPGVTGIRPVARFQGSVEPADRTGLGRAPQEADSIYGGLAESLNSLEIPQAHGLGFQGTGVRIGILDGTFLQDHATIRNRNPRGTRDFVDADASPFSEVADPPGSASHGTALWSILAGDFPGVLRGAAPGAEILLARVRGFGALAPVDEDRWVAGLEWLESQGARIVVSGVSFRNFEGSGYTINDLNGDGTPATRAADEAARRGVLVVTPAGNNGPAFQTLEAPSDGDSVLAVGAVDSRGVPAAFSASGPTADGRAKPDLFAPGVAVEAASSADQQALERVSGTEFAGALLAGAAALVVEAHPDRGPMEIMEILGQSRPPGQGVLVGLPHAASAILFPDGLTLLPLQEVRPDGQITDLAPQFQWTVPTLHPLGLPVTFHLELSEDSLFRSIALADSAVGTFARRPGQPLPPRTTLFWRVRARSIQGVERIATADEPISVPSWVKLEVLDEPSGSELVDPQPEFVWSSPEVSAGAGPLGYVLQILSDRESELIQQYVDLPLEPFRVPTALPFNLPLRWRVIATARNGAADTATSAGPFVITSGANPPATILYQNFPNPFPNVEYGGMETRIWFDLAEEVAVELAIYDIRGRLVRHLIPAPGCPQVRLSPGLYGRAPGEPPDPCVILSWNGLDDGGREVDAGVYLLRLKAGGVVGVRRIVFWP